MVVEECVVAAVTDIGIPHDQATVIDSIGVALLSAECAEVLHGTATVEEGVLPGRAVGIGIAHDLPAVVDAIGETGRSAWKRPEIGDGVLNLPPRICDAP